MAKKQRSTGLVRFISRMADGFSTPVPLGKTTLDTDGGTSMSSSERDAMARRIDQTTGPQAPRQGMDSYGKYIKPLTAHIAQTKLDNAAMRVLAPEIRTAENIVIPSIMSPTDLRDGEIKLLSTSSLVDDEVNTRISEVLDTHFNKNMKLSVKLPEWIREALYGAGAKPLLCLPITELDIIMNDPTAVLSVTKTSGYSAEAIATHSLESLTTASSRLADMDGVEKVSIFGIADSIHKPPTTTKKDKDSSLELNSLRPAIESALSGFMKEVGATPIDSKKADTPYNLEAKFKSGQYTELQAFATEAIANLAIVDNPDILKLDKAKKAKKQAELSQNIVVHFKTKMLITLNPEKGASKGNPVVYELPPESVIPVFTPGTPTDHIGYFIAIDEFGNPIHLGERDQDNNLGDNRRTSPGALYKSFGMDSQFHIGSQHSTKIERDALMVNIYQTIIDAHLKGRLKNSGMENTYIGATENVYRCMFSRYLSERKTKLLFVPKDFMTYFCFQHNHDGTGRSQLEDIKFILSLKITLVVCRMMAAMNSAINRKKINVQFTDEMGDPVQYIEMIKKEAIDKAIVSFTYDPSEITRTLAQRSLTVNAKGIPGAENFDITQEPNEYKNISPDNELMDDLNNMMVLSLDVPPSAMNLLAENEFSRSVATNNLFFSRRIQAKQKIVCELVVRYVQNYVLLSEELKKDIRDILNLGTKDKDGKTSTKEQGTVDEDTSEESVNAKIIDIIKHITATLPAPDVAPNKTEFEELDGMITALTSALEGIFDNDLASDDPIPAMRALIKSKLIRDYMTRIGVSKDVLIPDIEAGFLQELIDYKQKLANMKAGLATVIKVTTPIVPAESLGGDNPSGTGGMDNNSSMPGLDENPSGTDSGVQPEEF